MLERCTRNKRDDKGQENIWDGVDVLVSYGRTKVLGEFLCSSLILFGRGSLG